MTQRLAQLILRFRQQQRFAEEYSPLYAALFGTVADWLTCQPQDPLVAWLLETSKYQASFDVSNLLAAAVHNEVLSGTDEVSALAAFYPTVGGNAWPHSINGGNSKESKAVSQQFVKALYSSLLARRSTIGTFIQKNSVQTNETGRGVSWLLPSCLARWKEVHLLDLGASAGLNLIAEQRAFHLLDESASPFALELGLAESEQFIVHTNDGPDSLFAAECPPPLILSRTGCDVHPIQLESTASEQILASFIWADQVERLKRLREGIISFHHIKQSAVPVRLFRLSLPEELPAFLETQQNGKLEPLLIYNTYIKTYLPEKGAKLRDIISEWAVRQNRPIVWIQWEPPSTIAFQNIKAPYFGWLAWTADIWHNDKHNLFQLGWVHPHGQQVQWLEGLESWISYWS